MSDSQIREVSQAYYVGGPSPAAEGRLDRLREDKKSDQALNRASRGILSSPSVDVSLSMALSKLLDACPGESSRSTISPGRSFGGWGSIDRLRRVPKCGT